jgi:G3E family GTPase
LLKNDKGYKIAVIVNDIGEVNIDADLIEEGGVVNSKDDSLVPLQNGCICCTLKQDLIDQICDLVGKQKFDHIVIEASGICEPVPIAQTIVAIGDMCKQNNMPEICHLDAVVSVVDAKRLADEFECGEALTKQDLDDDDLENLVFQQLEFCDVIVLNKIDDVSPENLQKVKAVIKRIQPVAKIIETNYANVEINEVVDTNLFDFDRSASSAGWIREMEKDEEDEEEGETEEYGIGTYVYNRKEPFDFKKFEEFCNEDWKKQIVRSKGILYFSNNLDMCYLFESAGKQKTLRENGAWWATMPKNELETLRAEQPELFKGWDEKYGDREIKLVFIGQNLDKKALKQKLDNI